MQRAKERALHLQYQPVNTNMSESYDAIAVGSGPNGLAAAITLAQAGQRVGVYEAENTIGGGTRSAEVTLPGFTHDIYSAIHPLGVSSPFFRGLSLAEHGLEWIHPPAPVAHPFDDGTDAMLERSVTATGETLGKDAAAYQRLMKPLGDDWDHLANEILGPLLLPPRHPFTLARFGLKAIRSAQGLAESTFEGGGDVHGMCGYHAAQLALKRDLRDRD